MIIPDMHKERKRYKECSLIRLQLHWFTTSGTYTMAAAHSQSTAGIPLPSPGRKINELRQGGCLFTVLTLGALILFLSFLRGCLPLSLLPILVCLGCRPPMVQVPSLYTCHQEMPAISLAASPTLFR